MIRAVKSFEDRVCNYSASFGLVEELRQLKGLRKIRMKTHGPGDQEIVHLDSMIHERLVKLLSA
jgi:hypothetical protein